MPILSLMCVAAWGASVDSIFAPLVEPKTPGLAVLARKDGHTIFQRGYGVRDLNKFAKIDSKTNFRLASFSKQFTAMAIMLLVHDGKLGYEQRLTDIFLEFPEYGRAITILHLLTHTSGLPDYEDLMAEVEKAKGPTWTATHQIQDEEVLRLLEQQTGPKFAPGSGWAYSNSGYVLLGMIAAKISGEPFDKLLHDRIFEPLHMRHTLAYVSGKIRCETGHTATQGRERSSSRQTRARPRRRWAMAASIQISSTWRSGTMRSGTIPC